MESKTVSQVSRTRREFLAATKGVGILGAIAVLLGRGATVDNASLVNKAAKDPPGSGYHETEHIRKYYDSIRY